MVGTNLQDTMPEYFSKDSPSNSPDGGKTGTTDLIRSAGVIIVSVPLPLIDAKYSKICQRAKNAT
jgi:hypothetical protein